MDLYVHLFNLVNFNHKYSWYPQGLIQVLDKLHRPCKAWIKQASPASTHLLGGPRRLAVPGQMQVTEAMGRKGY